jgi:hypothetical protein
LKITELQENIEVAVYELLEVAVYELLGKPVLAKTQISPDRPWINRQSLKRGTYLLKAADNRSQVLVSGFFSLNETP